MAAVPGCFSLLLVTLCFGCIEARSHQHLRSNGVGRRYVGDIQVSQADIDAAEEAAEDSDGEDTSLEEHAVKRFGEGGDSGFESDIDSIMSPVKSSSDTWRGANDIFLWSKQQGGKLDSQPGSLLSSMSAIESESLNTARHAPRKSTAQVPAHFVPVLTAAEIGRRLDTVDDSLEDSDTPGEDVDGLDLEHIVVTRRDLEAAERDMRRVEQEVISK